MQEKFDLVLTQEQEDFLMKGVFAMMPTKDKQERTKLNYIEGAIEDHTQLTKSELEYIFEILERGGFRTVASARMVADIGEAIQKLLTKPDKDELH